MGTCVCSAIVGGAYILALLFAIPNVDSFVDYNNGDNGTSNLAVATYILAVPQQGALALTILLVINVYFAGMSSITVTSRIGYRILFLFCPSDSILPLVLFFVKALQWLVMVYFHSRPTSVGSSH